jgi:hypothetical protein
LALITCTKLNIEETGEKEDNRLAQVGTLSTREESEGSNQPAGRVRLSNPGVRPRRADRLTCVESAPEPSRRGKMIESTVSDLDWSFQFLHERIDFHGRQRYQTDGATGTQIDR